MAKKSRYLDYLNGIKSATENKDKRSTPQSILKQLQEFKHEEFRMQIAIGGADGK